MGHNFKLIGAPCASRGPYTFFKAFKYTKNNVTNILAINEFFFVKLWNDSDLICIGELRLLWEDKSCDQALASLRLYILPENTPDGRSNDIHGEDEVLAITEKVVIRLEDLLTWITEASDWNWGLSTVWQQECDVYTNNDDCKSSEKKPCGGSSSDTNCLFCDEKIHTLVDCSAVDYSDVHKEKRQLDMKNWETRTGVVVLSYSRYCRYRGLIKRLEGVHNEWLRSKLIKALGGFTTTCRTTKILFCKDTFDYPELEGHELLCNHLAPKLRSRIPKKKKVLYPSPDVSDDDSSSECGTDDEHLSSSASSSSVSTNSRSSNATSRSSNYVQDKVHNQHSLPGNVPPISVKDARPVLPDSEKKQKAFIQNLYSFMRARLTPIGRLPQIGNREINLYEFYNKVKNLGGHSAVTNNKLWKLVFEEMGGEQNNAAATSLARKHYEKFLLPYEQHMAQQLKHANSRHAVKVQNDAVIKSESTSVNVTEFDARKKPIASSRPEQTMPKPGVPTNHVKTGPINNAFSSKPGDKENIPLATSTAKKATVGASRPEVIDLCDVEDDRHTTPTKTSNPSAGNSGVGSSTTSPDVIDLCGESPIRRSVPSIAATLMPRKRKLDILKEGGLEVTPISVVNLGTSSSRDVVTITRQPCAGTTNDSHIPNHHNQHFQLQQQHANSIAAYMERLSASVPEAEMSLELVDPKCSGSSSSSGSDDDYSSSNHHSVAVSKRQKPHQVLDLRTIRKPVDSCNLLKSIGPSLGPNIEISLVPSDSSGGSSSSSNGSNNNNNNINFMQQRRDEKRRKSIQLPVPALRKISTGELTMKMNNSGSSGPGSDTIKGRANSAAASSAAEAAAKNYAEAFVSVSAGPVETTLTPSSFCPPVVGSNKKQMPNISAHVPDVEQYYSALYGSIVSAAAAAATSTDSSKAAGEYILGGGGLTVTPDANMTAHGLQLSPAELIYMSAPTAHLRQQRPELPKSVDLNDKSMAMYDTYRQKLAAILKNNTVSIIENYEKIVPD